MHWQASASDHPLAVGIRAGPSPARRICLRISACIQRFGSIVSARFISFQRSAPTRIHVLAFFTVLRVSILWRPYAESNRATARIDKFAVVQPGAYSAHGSVPCCLREPMANHTDLPSRCYAPALRRSVSRYSAMRGSVARSRQHCCRTNPTTPSYAGFGLGAASINQRSVLYPLWQAGESLIGVGLGSSGVTRCARCLLSLASYRQVRPCGRFYRLRCSVECRQG